MATALDWLQQRPGITGLIGKHTPRLLERTWEQLQGLQQWPEPYPPRILLSQSDPVEFLAGFVAATHRSCPLFLANPDWGEQEWHQVRSLVQPELIWSAIARPAPEFELHLPAPLSGNTTPQAPRSPWIMIPTGGSSGQIRFAIHTWESLLASVSGFQRYFFAPDLGQPINCCCVLPLYHVSGLMQFLRSLATGGQLVILPARAIATAPEQAIFEPETFFLSLVPTQLHRLLQQPQLIPWLRRFRAILLGGGPMAAALLAQARSHQLPLAPTYGMTETAAQIATLKPQEFLQGNASCGQVLPHARIKIQGPDGQILGPNQTGCIHIEATSLALGYYSPSGGLQSLPDPGWPTDDLGFLDDHGDLHLVGRSSRKIITGGENVYPEEVEAAIWATEGVEDVCVIGLPDPEWGEVVVAVYLPRQPEITPAALANQIKPQLSKFKQPKYWLTLPHFPRTAQGKVNFAQIRQMAQQLLFGSP